MGAFVVGEAFVVGVALETSIALETYKLVRYKPRTPGIAQEEVTRLAGHHMGTGILINGQP